MTHSEFELNNIATSAKEYSTNNKIETLADTSNGKYQRTYNQLEAATAIGNDPRNIESLCEKLGIDCKDGRRFFLTADDIALLNESENSKVIRGAGTEPAVWCITQQKGGSCKTTLVVTIATGIAAECLNHFRVGVIDGDPQGTATRYLKPNFDENDLSVGDLLTDNYNADEFTFEEACKSAFYATNHPNLRVLCAREEDRNYEAHIEKKRIDANKNNEKYTSHRDIVRIIEAVKNDFDIIFIDTSPFFSSANYAAHYAANNLMAPIQPTENDLDGFEKYAHILSDSYSVLVESGHKGYDNIVIQPANVESSKVHKETVLRMRYETFPDNCSPFDFVNSDAVLNISKEFCTIYDQSASEYTGGTQKSLRRAQELTLPIIRDIEERCLEGWSK